MIRAGLIPQIAPLIQQITASPVFMGAGLIQTVLELAGESDVQNEPPAPVQ